MNTSSFKISGDHPFGVSIAGWAPEGYRGRQYKKLAPKFKSYVDYIASGDTKQYTERYYAEVLDKLDPKKVFEDLGENAVLLCYEDPGIFCHRRIVADWLEKHLKILVSEITPM